MLNENVIRRLAFIRYLLNVATEQSRLPEPMSSSALLTFHDCIELFLQLGSEHLNVSKKADGLLDYWQIIKDEKGINLG